MTSIYDMNRFLKNIILIIISIFIALLIAEGAARLVYDPIDFLKPITVRDEVLRYRIEPGSGAHDLWGFRNKGVPAKSDIVAIGDSQTYGISAQARSSWPSQLEGLSGKSVYNMSLPGYGPAEYLLLLKDKALKLMPDLIVVGFYLGNDLKDSFTAVYSVPVWENMRDPEISKAGHDDLPVEKKGGSLSPGDWLSANSVLYRLISSSVIGDNLRQHRRIARGEEVVMLNDKEHGISTGFTPDRRLKGLDLDNPEVAEGVTLALEFFNQMNALANENRIAFLVVIIPTKESVFADLIEGNKTLQASEKIDRLLSSERKVNETATKYFAEHGIEYIDLLPSLQEAAYTEQIYPANFGGHTNKNGYRAIAETIHTWLVEPTGD
jgi:lysophospholipase L1-like esterase